MKRLYIAYLLLILTALLCGFAYYLVTSNAKEMKSEMESVKASAHAENYELASKQLDSIEKKWTERHKIFAVFCPHYDIHEIDITIIPLRSYLNSNTINDFYAYTDIVIARLNHILENEIPSIENIF